MSKLLISIILYLSTVGIETNRFNSQIISKIKTNEPNLEPLNTVSSIQETREHKEISEPLDDKLTNGRETLEPPTQSKKILTEETFEDKGPEAGSAEERLAEQTAVEETPVLSAQDHTDSMEKAKQTDIEIGKKAAITDFQNKCCW